jgi:hypothetical protein
MTRVVIGLRGERHQNVLDLMDVNSETVSNEIDDKDLQSGKRLGFSPQCRNSSSKSHRSYFLTLYLAATAIL